MRRPAVALLLATLAAGCAVLTPIYVGPRSDHFDGIHFHSYEAAPAGALGDAWRRINPFHRHGRWPEWEETPTDTPPPRVGGTDVRVTFVNHATVLIQTAGLNILTDPVWSKRIGPFEGIGVERHRPPGIRFDDLPAIDVVLISHDHYDHMDIPTLRRIASRDHPRILTGLGNAGYLALRGVPGGRDLDWWQSDSIGPGIRITGVPARHWSARGIDEHDRTLWLGFAIETPSGTIYFAGDTGYGDFLRAIHERFPEIRLALLPIAPERPRKALAARHMSAGDAVRAARLLGAGSAMGIHFGTFRQGDDADGEPADSLRAALAPLGGAACEAWFWAPRNGDSRVIPAMPAMRARETGCPRPCSSAGCSR
jgi:L-ascorbate metabolism protein UlaG (beta-lactamase superfamily)